MPSTRPTQTLAIVPLVEAIQPADNEMLQIRSMEKITVSKAIFKAKFKYPKMASHVPNTR